MIPRATMALLALAGCDWALGLSARERPPDALVLPECQRDDFDDNSIDATKWMLSDPTNFPVVVSEVGQELRFLHPMLRTGQNALNSTRAFDITGGHLQVEVSQPPSIGGFIDSGLFVVKDATNYYMINVAGGDLVFRVTKDGVNSNVTVKYAVTDVFWRIRHDNDTSEVVFETSADGTSFLERRRGPATVPVDVVYSALAGDSYQGPPTDATVAFDDIELVGPNCQ